ASAICPLSLHAALPISARAGLGRGLHRRNVAAHDGGDVAAADLLVADQLDLRGFYHRVGGLDHADEALGLDEAQCVCHGVSLSRSEEHTSELQSQSNFV